MVEIQASSNFNLTQASIACRPVVVPACLLWSKNLLQSQPLILRERRLTSTLRQLLNLNQIFNLVLQDSDHNPCLFHHNFLSHKSPIQNLTNSLATLANSLILDLEISRIKSAAMFCVGIDLSKTSQQMQGSIWILTELFHTIRLQLMNVHIVLDQVSDTLIIADFEICLVADLSV